MQAEMLDSAISQNPQDNSVEYVDSHENPIATIPRDGASVQDVEDPRSLELIFGQKHNDIDCALCPTAKRACNRAWFSAKQVENWSEMSKMTLWRWLERIEKARRISRVSDMIQWKMPHEQGGSTPTTLYNLNVLNQLAMACIDNEKLNDISCKFSDMLSEKMTERMSGTQPQPQPTLPTTYLEALEALVASEKAKLALQAERDEAVRTKAEIGSRREATAMNTASQKSKECEKLREQIGDSKTYKAAKAIPWLSEYFNTRNRGLYNALAHKLKKIEADMPSKFAHIMIDDSQYGQIKAYHIGVIEKLHEMVQADEEFMKDYRKGVSPKTKNA